MTSILIIFSTTDGHTKEICLKIKAVAEQQNQNVRIISIDDAFSEDLEKYDKIVIGASIRYGKHNKTIYDFVDKNTAILNRKTSTFFSVNVVARKPDKNTPETNPYVLKFLEQVSWRPDRVAVFAGEIDYRKYHFLDRLIIRFIMTITHGPTKPGTVTDFTNWTQVEEFGQVICDM